MKTQEVKTTKPKRKLGTLLMAGLMATGIARIGGSFAQRICNDHFHDSTVINADFFHQNQCELDSGTYTWTGFDPTSWTGCEVSPFNPAAACFTDPIPRNTRTVKWAHEEGMGPCDFSYEPFSDTDWQFLDNVTTATPFPCLS